MREAGRRMNGLSLHYYCGSGDERVRSATQFDEEDWFANSAACLAHGGTGDASTRRSWTNMTREAGGLVVDEWGAWHDVEPGTNPGFLYQQNTLRDALVAGLTLNIFNQHATACGWPTSPRRSTCSRP